MNFDKCVFLQIGSHMQRLLKLVHDTYIYCIQIVLTCIHATVMYSVPAVMTSFLVTKSPLVVVMVTVSLPDAILVT